MWLVYMSLDCWSHLFWAVDRLCLWQAILGTCSGFFIVCDSVWVSILYANVKIYSRKLGSLSSSGDFHLCDFFSKNSTSLNSMCSHSCCSISFVLSSSLLIHSASSLCSFSLLHNFFPKLFNFFYRMRYFDFDGLFTHLPVEFLSISLKYFIIPVEFRPFFKSFDSLWFVFFVLFCLLLLLYHFHFEVCIFF